MKPKVLRAIDVCGGAGGWACAARGLPIQIVAAFDLQSDALKTYELNHPGVETVIGDVTTQDFGRWRGKVDLILGGIPCEQIASHRHMHKTSPEEMASFHQLLTRFLALPSELGARWWCYEDVKQIERHLPLMTPHFTVDSASHSAQRRPWMFVGNCPMPERGHSLDVLGHKLRRGPFRVGQRLHGRSPSRHNPQRPDVFYPWEPDQKSPTVTALTSQRDAEAATRHGERWRQLEWQELAGLMGFPEDYLFFGSPSRVTKMVAQAIQIDVGRAILKTLCETVKL